MPEWKQLLSSLTIKGNTYPLILELWFIGSLIDLHSNNTLFFLLGLGPSNGTWTQYLVTLCYHDNLLSPPELDFLAIAYRFSALLFCSPLSTFPNFPVPWILVLALKSSSKTRFSSTSYPKNCNHYLYTFLKLLAIDLKVIASFFLPRQVWF